ncbi:MAG TPA: hypothetical protein GXX29_11470 [Firmicutes bacterium]|nr:hypothetical protein [Bacillota bacterium]
MKTMKQKEAAQELVGSLNRLGLPAHLGEAVGEYGWSVCIEGQPGRVVVYFGKNGRKMVSELKKATPALQEQLRQAWEEAGSLPAGSEKGVQIWVDGSCVLAGGQSRLGWGLLIFRDGREICRESGSDIPPEAGSMRNVAGEIFAVLRALRWCREKDIKSVTIHYDYEGLEKWALGQWQANNPFTRRYAEAVRTSGIIITWKKVRAHSGDRFNTEVDRLAQEAARAAFSI